jgi:hypothetical protein
LSTFLPNCRYLPSKLFNKMQTNSFKFLSFSWIALIFTYLWNFWTGPYCNLQYGKNLLKY